MNSNNRCKTSVCAAAVLAVASLGFSPAAWALGLGDARVESFLNQPLQVRIDLISQASDDLTSVTARLASAADYELIGASREAVSVPIGFSIEDIDGDAYILATSNLPISEPVLRLIVEVSWSSGRMLREYTLFLDPPAVPEPAPAPRIDQRQPAAARPAEAPSDQATVQPGERPAAQAPAPSGAQPPAGSEYGPVRSGQTLWGIARDWSRDSGMNINQVMLAIQRENPDAFLQDNINLLKRGAILRMPSASDVDLVSAAAAYREVVSQEEAFRGRAAVPTAASPETPLLARESAAIAVAGEEQEPAIAEEVPTAVEDEPAAAGDEPAAAAAADQAVAEQPAVAETVPEQDLLELVPPSADSELDSASGFEESPDEAGADVAAQALREELARTEEELITQQQQNAYLEERIRELESQVESRDEGRVADADLANMEDRLREQRQAPVQTPREESRPWYARMGVWLIGLLVLAAAFVGWLVSRRGMRSGAAVAGAHDSLRDIKSEAEDVLRVLADDRKQQPGHDADKAPGKPEATADKAPPARPRADDDAELLDEESSDPEIQLDLARAYISMGDKEAARVILQEVVNNGSDAQQAEARKMLGFL